MELAPSDIESKREELGRNGVTILKETCVPSLNPKICLGTSTKRGGRSLYAKEAIAEGEWIWRDVPGYEAAPKTWEFIAALPEAARRNFQHFCYCACSLHEAACPNDVVVILAPFRLCAPHPSGSDLCLELYSSSSLTSVFAADRHRYVPTRPHSSGCLVVETRDDSS
ncbi:MAG: hypothetical protein P4L40_26795 [Terracidiphilus sp.]|nr:hypothetical protein [Terracidiphilus sp.]